MEANTLLEFFFIGEDKEEIKEFIRRIGARCLKGGGEFDVKGEKKHLLIYERAGETSYIDAHMSWYKKCPHCGSIVPEDEIVTVKIERSQRVRPERARYFTTEETLCSHCLESEDFVVLDAQSSEDEPEYLYRSNGRTFRCFDEYNEETGEYSSHWYDCNRTNSIGWNWCQLDDNGEELILIPQENRVIYRDRFLEVLEFEGQLVTVLKTTLEACPTMQKCSQCGRWCKVSDLENGLCRSCAHPEIKIYSYHHWPKPVVFKKSESDDANEQMFFGIEIETTGSTANKRFVAPYQEIWHLEQDASIGHTGFEMISQPMTFNYIRENYEGIKAMFESLSAAGQVSHETSVCGFHIHVSKDAFDGIRAINRAVAICHGLKREMEKFGRRNNGEYYRFYNLKQHFSREEFNQIDVTGHYCAVNTSGRSSDHRDNTVEFRFPRGTLNPVTFMATIEFIRNIVAMANDRRVKVKFGDLLDGEYIPEYIQARSSFGVRFNKEAYIAFAKVRLEDSYNAFLNDLNSIETCQNFVNEVQAISSELNTPIEGTEVSRDFIDVLDEVCSMEGGAE